MMIKLKFHFDDGRRRSTERIIILRPWGPWAAASRAGVDTDAIDEQEPA
jgi:hypothetical protein